jgi:hypothetical protein
MSQKHSRYDIGMAAQILCSVSYVKCKIFIEALLLYTFSQHHYHPVLQNCVCCVGMALVVKHEVCTLGNRFSVHFSDITVTISSKT